MLLTLAALALTLASAEPSANAVPAAAPSVSAAVEADLTRLLAAHDTAWSTHDTKALAALFTSDCTVVTPNGKRIVGQAELLAMFATPAPNKTTTTISRTRVLALQLLAPDVVLIDAAQQVMDAPDVRMGARMLFVARRSDGVWRIAAVRLNPT